MIEQGEAAVDAAGKINEERNEKDVDRDLKIAKKGKVFDCLQQIPVDAGQDIDRSSTK